MFVDYEVIQKIEVLNEVGAGVLADFSRQLEKMNISIEERENPIIILYWQTVRLKNNFIKMNTIEELKDAQAQLKFVSQYIKKLRDCNKGVEGMKNNYCDCDEKLLFMERVSVLDEYDDKLLVCNKYYCPKCFDEYEINEEVTK